MIKVNAIGDSCPIPVIKTKIAMKEMTGPDTIEVLVDNEIAVQNVTKMAQSSGGKVTSEKVAEKEYRILIAMGEACAAKDSEEVSCIPDKRGSTIVVVSSDRMGSGNDELGAVLMKSFFFAETQLDTLPDKILFYNGGAKLTVEGSDCLEDIRILEKEGVEILTCGTCLDFYGLKEKLAVGAVTNMYTIAEILQNAVSVVSP
mgnify:CR=1 FL=1